MEKYIFSGMEGSFRSNEDNEYVAGEFKKFISYSILLKTF